MPSSDIDRAMEVFARGFAFDRSATYPCLAERIGHFWVVRDAHRSRASAFRREEWITRGLAAAQVDAFVRKNTRGHFCICEICARDEDEQPIRAAYKVGGYRLGTTEPFMVHHLDRIPCLAEPFPIERVTTLDLADRLAAATKKRPIAAEYLAPDSPMRAYVALDAGRAIGWTRSIKVGKSNWVAGMHVISRYRRRGIGKSLLARMLRDDRAAGSNGSVLLASHTGALLYPNVGYEMLGRLLLYTPPKR